MIKKIRDLSSKHAIPAAIITFVLFDLLLQGLGRLLSLLPKTLTFAYLIEIVMIAIPIAIVFLFGFGSAYKKGSFGRGIVCCLPFIIVQAFALFAFFVSTLKNPETSWQSWDVIVYSIFSIFCVGIREESFYRATIQNIVAKKHANSVKGVWTTVITSSLLFGLCHISNVFHGVKLGAVLVQVLFAAVVGLLFGAVYLRSGSIWALIIIHTFTDIAGLAESSFIKNVSFADDVEKIASSFSWSAIIIRLIYIGIVIFLLRPSKCKQIYENLCFAEKNPEEKPEETANA